MKGYGILNVNPNSDFLPKSQDSFTRAVGISNDIYGMVGKHYENKFKDAQARNANAEASLREGTLNSDINAKNTKNQTDIQYYPQMQAAKLAEQGATIKEIQAKTGLSYAQTKHALAMASNSQSEGRIGGAQGKLFAAYEAAPAGSPQKAYFGALLNKEMGGYAPTEGGMMGGNPTSSIPGTPRGNSIPTSVGGIETNPLGGGPRAVFHQGYNSQTGETMESPTTPSAGRNQNRTEATAEMGAIEPVLKAGMQPYMGAGGSVKLAADAWKARNHPDSKEGKEAEKRLLAYNVSQKLKREAANIISRQSAGQAPGVEASREQEAASFGGGPFNAGNYLTPPKVLQQAQDQYFVRQKELADAAVNQERQGYKQPGEQPAWAGQEGQSRGGFGSGGYVPPQTRVASGFNGNPNMPPPQRESPQQQSHPQEFQSKEQAQAYFKSLSPEQKRRYLDSLPG